MKTAVLRGGPSGEHEVSLKTGDAFLRNMPEGLDSMDIVIGKDGVWRWDGREIAPARALSFSDVVVNALHGDYGEDGTLQRELENAGVAFTGSGSMESRIAMNKREAKRIVGSLGIKVADYLSIAPEEPSRLAGARVYQKFTMPVVVKPLSSGSSLGVSIVDRKQLIEAAIDEAREHSSYVLVEEYIKGREATCGVIDQFRGEHIYALPPVEIRPSTTFFDYDAKYCGGTEEICPGRFSSEEKKEIEDIARKAHQVLGLRHYSRTDLIVSSRGIYFLEVNTLPGMTEESLFPKALKAIGSDFKEFISHVVNLSAPKI